MIDMKASPYYLSEEDCKWVEETIASMTTEEKIGQLFFNMGSSREEDYLKMTVNQYHIGGIRYNPAKASEVQEQNRVLQANSKIPLIIACNTENGGNGACTDGTYIGNQTKIAATGKAEYAKALGFLSNKEAAAIGCNLSFAPVADIYYNWHNPVVGLRTYGSQPDLVEKMTLAYMEGAHENPGFACAAKHFPGDGLDERDQHVANSVNSFTCEEWDATYGRVYQNLIDNGLEAIMAGHIMLPSYTRYYHKNIKDEDIMPATLSKEIITDLLKGKMGFQGMVLTDASHMVGLTCRMKRSDMLPAAIAAGCDMFLFFNDMEEDFQSMMKGYENGMITEERLQDALHRILALKAHMGLHRKAKQELVPGPEAIEAVIGCDAHKAMQKEISQQSLTLVKYKDSNIFPVTPQRYPRIRIVYVTGLQATNSIGGAMMKMMGGTKKNPAERLQEKLEERGFQVSIYESPIARLEKQAAEGQKVDFNAYFAGKDAIADFVGEQDLILTIVDVAGGFQCVARPGFGMTKGGGEIPWYVHELPVIVAATGQPTILADIPQARTYLNLYDGEDSTLESFVEQMMTGATSFQGHDPIDSYCGLWDTRL